MNPDLEYQIIWSYYHPDFNPETDAAAIESSEPHQYYADLYEAADEAYQEVTFGNEEYHDEFWHEECWLEVRSHQFAATQFDIRDASLDENGELWPISDVGLGYVTWSTDYWRAAYEEAMQ